MMKRGFTLVCLMFVALFTESQNRFTQFVSSASEKIDNGDYRQGIAELNKAIKCKDEAPNNYKVAEAYLVRGLCHYNLQRNDDALRDIEKALALKPEFLKAHTARTTVLLGSKRYEECIRWGDSALAIHPGNIEVLMAKGQAHAALKAYPQSNAVFRRVLSINSGYVDALLHLGSNGIRTHSWDTAIRYMSMALEIDPQNIAAYYDRGISKSFLQDLQGAKEDIEKAMQLDSLSTYVGFNNIGFFLKLEKGDYEGAIPYFDKAIALSPGFAFAYCNRGFCRMKLKDYRGARADILKSISLDNRNSYAYKNLGLLLLEEEKSGKACENFHKADALGYSEEYDDEVKKLIQENCK
jgi:tetratricopeptide (TPR) repeat protein